MSTPLLIGLVYLISELLLTMTRRSRGRGAVRQDRSTLRVLWLVIMLSVAGGVYIAEHGRATALSDRRFFTILAVAFFVPGLALRWWAIILLGRFFTVDVSIAPDHELVERGPYRRVRHPSYTGVLLAFLGFAFSLANWAALLVMMVPILAAFIHRMNIEEQALQAALGERYAAYMRRTKRLMPGVY